ncbi:hypothetical protein TTHERM_00340130 (macronuclear) [Tetrahymena thermophila SB210]|uniref:Transmembrane protein n=1 Tax=Tetrahymena thermophila (strain SB210) TaxID=312017 RepID=I7MK21_TETTS|nr:hypothetical protein TTHERM_00340130 [Tetrahymena thermophila SB210]EAR97432.2 hypothetical protein TTHERM_00340130 [Tetrahymena thermophila SB210]|eukprot:XP_001017677.2 hypothetical protein TTHERM_00340130 [Tetrahymena thermophila SB210]
MKQSFYLFFFCYLSNQFTLLLYGLLLIFSIGQTNLITKHFLTNQLTQYLSFNILDHFITWTQMRQTNNQITIIQSDKVQDNNSSSNSPMRKYLMDKREQKRIKKIFSEHKKNEARLFSVPKFSKDDPTIRDLEIAKYNLQKYSRELPAFQGLKKQLISQETNIKLLRVNNQKGNLSYRQSKMNESVEYNRQSQLEQFLKNTRNQSFNMCQKEQLPNVKQTFKDQAIKNYVFESVTKRNKIDDIIKKLEQSKQEISNKHQGLESPFQKKIQKLKEDRLKSQEREFNIYNSMPFDPCQRKIKRERYLAYKFDPELPFLTLGKFHPKNKINDRYSNITNHEVLEQTNDLNIDQNSSNMVRNSIFDNQNLEKNQLQQGTQIFNTQQSIVEASRRASVVSQLDQFDDQINISQDIEDQKFIDSVFNSRESSNKKMQKIIEGNQKLLKQIKKNSNSKGLFDSLNYFTNDRRQQNQELTEMLQQLNSNRDRTLQKKREVYQDLFVQSAQVSPQKKKKVRDDLNKFLQQILKDNKRQQQIFKNLIQELNNSHKIIPEDILEALDEMATVLNQGRILFQENLLKIQVLLDNYGVDKKPFNLIYNAIQQISSFDNSQTTNRSLDSTIQTSYQI